MPVGDAVILDNFLPRTADVISRNGYNVWASGLGGPVETLMEYDQGGAHKLFGAANGKIFDVSVNAAVGAPVVTGKISNRWQHAQFGTPGGQFITAVNGSDTPLQYDGTNWSNSTIAGAGLTASKLVNVNAYEQRLFFCENFKLGFWYLPITQITGTATYFDLASLATLGGYLQAIATWTVDGGQGPQNYAVFVTSRGQAIVYQGLDPSSASLWTLVGIYRIGAPIGRRCTLQYGSDLLIVTQDGVFPLSQALITGRATPRIAVTDKISGAVANATTLYGNNFGWQMLLYPLGNYGLVNVPTAEDSIAQQYIWSSITQQWARFMNQNAICWSLFNEKLYFGDPLGNVMLADNGNSDNGSVIVGEVLPAFDYFDSPGAIKQFQLCRPVFNAGGSVSPAVNINVDFDTTPPVSVPNSVAGGSPWDISPWNTSLWAPGLAIRKNFIGVNGVGYAGSLHTKVSSKTQNITLLSVDYIYSIGGFI